MIAIFIDIALFTPPSCGQVGQASKVTRLHGYTATSYTATPVTCEWAGAVKKKVTGAFGQEGLAQKAQKHQKKGD